MNIFNPNKIPKYVSHVTNTLEGAGFEAYLVGGCVRDLLISEILSGVEKKREPKDWDITTNAKPEQIMALFEKTVYENTFGTVGVVVSWETLDGGVSQETNDKDVSRITSESDHIKLATSAYSSQPLIIEVTPFRTETQYSDFRHPDEVVFSDKLEDDLKRRDFTVNALAYRNGVITDIFDGIKDMESKVLRTVGNPDDRFAEDALRMMRAIRFAMQLDFTISAETGDSILKNSALIKNISFERIRDEFIKIIMSKTPAVGLVMLQKYGLLKYIIPELEEGIGCEQSGEHIYDVWNHLLHALQHAADKNWPLEIRLSALFHDIGKPRSRRNSTNVGKKKYTFYGHEVVGERISKKILERLKFSKKESDLIEKLIRNHMFFSDTELITLSAVRRIIVKVGAENIWHLMNVRECDRVGMKKKEAPYRLRKYFAMIEEALHDPVSVKQLKINGEYLIKDMGIIPGPRMGWILNALLEEVIDDPTKNNIKHLSELVISLNILPDDALRTLGERGKEKKEELEDKEVKKLHQRHRV